MFITLLSIIKLVGVVVLVYTTLTITDKKEMSIISK